MLVRCEGSNFFFQNSIGNIHSHFEVIFTKDTEEGEGNEEGAKTSGGVFEQYGLLPLILKTCEHSNSTFDTVMSWPICQTFYIASYIITKNKYEEQQIKQMQLRNRL